MNDRRKPINTPLGRTLKNNIPITKIPQFKPIEAYHLFSFTCAPSRFALFITFRVYLYDTLLQPMAESKYYNGLSRPQRDAQGGLARGGSCY